MRSSTPCPEKIDRLQEVRQTQSQGDRPGKIGHPENSSGGCPDKSFGREDGLAGCPGAGRDAGRTGGGRKIWGGATLDHLRLGSLSYWKPMLTTTCARSWLPPRLVGLGSTRGPESELGLGGYPHFQPSNHHPMLFTMPPPHPQTSTNSSRTAKASVVSHKTRLAEGNLQMFTNNH